MERPVTTVLGRGLYSVADARRLIGAPASTVGRWAFGYKLADVEYRPVWESEYAGAGRRHALSFLDLQSARAVHELRKSINGRRLSLQTVRRFVLAAGKEWGTPYPLAHRLLSTDGSTIWTRMDPDDEDAPIVDLLRHQTALNRILKPFTRDVRFDDNLVAEWWPALEVAGIGHAVVVNPRFHFGAPVDSTARISTKLLAAAARVNASEEVAARWYQVSIAAVRASVAFESWLSTRLAA